VKRINILLTLLSLNAVLIIVERLSPTAKIILQPYNFLRFHEVFQITVVIALSVVISFFIFKYLSKDFENVKKGTGLLLGVVFVLGLYFTATGNGLHEVASFLFNTFCPTKLKIAYQTKACASQFFNDYYFGNIVYFLGLFLANVSLMFLERSNPTRGFTNKDVAITSANGLVYAFTLFAYGAFDLVLVGLGFCIVSAIVSDAILLTGKTNFKFLPFTLYSAIAYTASALAILLYRFH